MSTPVDHDLAARLRQAEEHWLDQCASRLRRARVRPRPAHGNAPETAPSTSGPSQDLTSHPTGATR